MQCSTISLSIQSAPLAYWLWKLKTCKIDVKRIQSHKPVLVSKSLQVSCRWNQRSNQIAKHDDSWQRTLERLLDNSVFCKSPKKQQHKCGILTRKHCQHLPMFCLDQLSTHINKPTHCNHYILQFLFWFLIEQPWKILAFSLASSNSTSL